MPRTVHIKDLQYNRYIVAGDVWDGAVYHQENTQRPNAVWALLLWDSVDYKEIYRLIDLRHGCDLVSREDGSVANIGIDQSSIIDIRAQWTLQDVASQRDTHTIQNGNGRHLYANGSNDGIKLGADTDYLNAQWKFESAAESYLDHKILPARLSIASGKINYTIDTSNAPANLTGLNNFSTEALLKVFDDAVSKWVQAFTEMGVRLKAQRGGTPADITFCWGKVDDTEEAGHVPGDLGNLASFFRDRTIIPVAVTLNQDKWWGGHGLKGMLGEYPDIFQLDVRSAVAHELGHVFGLEHCADPRSVMRPKLTTGEVWTHAGEPICPFDRRRLRARYIDTFFPS